MSAAPRRSSFLLPQCFFASILAAPALPAQDVGPTYGTLERLSMSSEGGESNASSGLPSVCGDATSVAFFSDASNLVANDTNGKRDVFVRIRGIDITILASQSGAGEIGDGDSAWPSISYDGRFVAFQSEASNLVENDTNAFIDVFVRDLLLNTTERVSVATGGGEADGPSFQPRISSNGRFVAFESLATNLDGNDQNGAADIYVHDRWTHTTVRASRGAGGAEPNAACAHAGVSDDGIIVVFESEATNLAPGDGNGACDVFVKNLVTGGVSRASVSAAEAEGNGASRRPRTTPDGRFVVFSSLASNLGPADANGAADVYVKDLITGLAERASTAADGDDGDGASALAEISDDGRFVVFSSVASNLVDEDNNSREDVFVYDRLTDSMSRVSVGDDGTQNNGFASYGSISAAGDYVVFMSDATNLIYISQVQIEIYGFDFATGPPAPPLPFATLDFSLTRGKIADGAKPDRDSFVGAATYAFTPDSVDGALDPAHEILEVRVGASGGGGKTTPLIKYTIPAGDPRWKKNGKGVYWWRTKKGAGPMFSIVIDTTKKRVRIVWAKFDWPSLPSNPVQVRVRAGNDLGMSTVVWTVGKSGKSLLYHKK